jgi:SAM-dependent methyltransferase
VTRSIRARSDAGKLSLEELSEILACPVCRGPLEQREAEARCTACGTTYGRLPYAWDLTPPRDRWSSGDWEAWEQLQQNGDVSYREDPEHNLGVGPREDYLAFSTFAELGGLVLDVGCGPQPWPTHFAHHEPGTRFVGIDPLVGTQDADYTQLRALAEYVPFADGAFDHVVFATSLDHFVDPAVALNEARRVTAPEGTVEVWVGHKRADAPPPAISPEWYRSLVKPRDADDVFHLRRLSEDDSEALFARAGLLIVRAEVHRVDEFRTNRFYKLATGL